jgi:hypothetical protein
MTLQVPYNYLDFEASFTLLAYSLRLHSVQLLCCCWQSFDAGLAVTVNQLEPKRMRPFGYEVYLHNRFRRDPYELSAKTAYKLNVNMYHTLIPVHSIASHSCWPLSVSHRILYNLSDMLLHYISVLGCTPVLRWLVVIGVTDFWARSHAVENIFNCSARPSVCTDETGRQGLNGFSWYLILKSFTKLCRHFPVVVIIGRQ